MSEIEKRFTSLLLDIREMGAGVRLQPLEVSTPEGNLWLAMDGDGTRHLLVPIPFGSEVSEQSGRALSWQARTERIHGKDREFADLACVSRPLDSVFSSLVADAVERVRSHPGNALRTVEQVLDEWRRLVARSRPMSEEQARGLYGELRMLEQLAVISGTSSRSLDRPGRCCSRLHHASRCSRGQDHYPGGTHCQDHESAPAGSL